MTINKNINNIVKLYLNEKCSLSTIAKQYNVQVRIIKKILQSQNIEIRSKTSYRSINMTAYHDKIIKDYQDGRSSREIAKELGVNKNTIIKYLEEQAIPIRTKCLSILEKDKEDIKDLYINKKLTTKEISHKYTISESAVLSFLHRNNVILRSATTSPYTELHKDIVELYELGHSTREIAQLLKIKSKSTILKALRKNGIKSRSLSESIRKYKINETVFDNITTEYQAYFLGLLYVDGNNFVNNYLITLPLKETDSEILLKFLEFLETDISLKDRIFDNAEPQKAAIITNKHLSQKLQELGVVNNKTFKITFPEWLNPQLYSHFIRGYFDGDGSIFLNRKDYCFSIVGTIKLLTRIQEILIKECSLTKTKLDNRTPERQTNIRNLRYSGNVQLQRIFNYLYNDATIYLTRKYDKFKEVL